MSFLPLDRQQKRTSTRFWVSGVEAKEGWAFKQQKRVLTRGDSVYASVRGERATGRHSSAGDLTSKQPKDTDWHIFAYQRMRLFCSCRLAYAITCSVVTKRNGRSGKHTGLAERNKPRSTKSNQPSRHILFRLLYIAIAINPLIFPPTY